MVWAAGQWLASERAARCIRRLAELGRHACMPSPHATPPCTLLRSKEVGLHQKIGVWQGAWLMGSLHGCSPQRGRVVPRRQRTLPLAPLPPAAGSRLLARVDGRSHRPLPHPRLLRGDQHPHRPGELRARGLCMRCLPLLQHGNQLNRLPACALAVALHRKLWKHCGTVTLRCAHAWCEQRAALMHWSRFERQAAPSPGLLLQLQAIPRTLVHYLSGQITGGVRGCAAVPCGPSHGGAGPAAPTCVPAGHLLALPQGVATLSVLCDWWADQEWGQGYGYTGNIGNPPVFIWSGVENSNPQAVVSPVGRALPTAEPLAQGMRMRPGGVARQRRTCAPAALPDGHCIPFCARSGTSRLTFMRRGTTMAAVGPPLRQPDLLRICTCTWLALLWGTLRALMACRLCRRCPAVHTHDCEWLVAGAARGRGRGRRADAGAQCMLRHAACPPLAS